MKAKKRVFPRLALEIVTKTKMGETVESTGLQRLHRLHGLQPFADHQQLQTSAARARLVQINDRGQRINESHPRAVLSDHEVLLLLQLRDEGFSLAWLAEKFEVSKSQAGRICRGEQRGQPAMRVKRK